MAKSIISAERRRDIRRRADDVIRWKRPGRAEDHKAWTVDRSPSSIGFITLADAAPQVAEVIHLRRLDGAGWQTIDRSVRIARLEPMPGDSLTLVGCTIE